MAPALVTACTALPPEAAAEPGGGPSVRRRSLIALAPALLAGCGFQLRQAPDFTFDSLLLNAPAGSPLATELARALTASGKVQVLRSPAPATPAGGAATPPPVLPPTRGGRVVFDLLQEQREKVVVGLNASGQVREFQLRLRVRFRARSARGEELVPETELVQHRDMSFNEQAVLAKEAEASLLYRDMQDDIVQQLMRRLSALRSL